MQYLLNCPVRLGIEDVILPNSKKVYKNQQKYQQNKNTQTTKTLWNSRNIFLALFIILLPFKSFAILHFMSLILYRSNIDSIMNPGLNYYPTSIPWIKDQVSCEKFDRTWKNDKCWDSEHSRFF